MAEIVNFIEYRTQRAVRKGFRFWQHRFCQEFNADTRLSDLSHATLSQLAQDGDDSMVDFYELILSFLGVIRPTDFDVLDVDLQIQVVDIHLFLADQVRFEMMFRLQWLNDFHCRIYTLFEMVQHFAKIKKACQCKPPQLAEGHPQFQDYQKLIDQDRQVFIRQMLPAARKAFRTAYGV